MHNSMHSTGRRFALPVRAAGWTLTGLMACISVLMICLFTWMAVDWFNTHRAFDAQVWRHNPGGLEGQDTPRSRMVNDLVSRHLRVGMTRRQVQALLGKPDYSSEWDEQHNRDVYGCGYEGRMGIDPSVLTLEYDAKGKLIKISYGET